MAETTGLVKMDETSLMKITENDVRKFFDKEGKCTPTEVALFLRIAQMNGLNPFNRELHLIKYGSMPASIITGYEVYLKRAESSGKWSGMKVWIDGDGKDMVARVKIYRSDWKEPLEHEVYYAEAVKTKADGTPTATWKSMPRFMLKKVAVAQGLRWAFPNEVGGLPYTADEMGLEKEEKTFKPEFEMPKPKEEAKAEAKKEEVKEEVKQEVLPPEETKAEEDDLDMSPVPAYEDRTITRKQQEMLFAKVREYSISELHMRKMIKTYFKKEHTTELTNKEFDKVLAWVEESHKAGFNKVKK